MRAPPSAPWRSALVAVAIGAASVVPIPSARAQAVVAWSEFLGNPSHTSYAADPAITSTNATQLGVKWMANLYTADLGSPVVAYNATLNATVVYVGDERADVFAIDANTGQQIWSTNLGFNDKVNATPAVAPDGSVWVGTNFSAALFKLNGATGQIECSVKSPDGMPIQGSAAIVTPPGGTTNVYWIANDGSTASGPVISTNESTCATNFQFYRYRTTPSGGWASPAYAVTAAGEPLVIVGTADPDSTVYAVDAITGALVWKYATYNPGHYDVGDGATISPPGTNGFADGVVYVGNKYGLEYALDLSTGAPIWQHGVYASTFSGYRNSISSSALDGNRIVFGYANGVTSLNATTGAALWTWSAPAEVASSPAIIGPAGSEVVAFGDLSGAFRTVGLAGGTPLYHYQTGGYVVSSVAESNGTMYIASSDGFLYAFAAGGGNGAPPAESISAPANQTTIPNPDGWLRIAGNSSDGHGVAAVEIAVQSGGASGTWYDAATKIWGPAPVRNHATLAQPKATATAWSFAVPVPAGGGSYTIFANAVGTSHIVDRGSTSAFTILPSTKEPTLSASAYYVTPGETIRVSGGGFASGEHVTLTFLSTTAQTTAEKSGKIPLTKLHVSKTAPFGPGTITAAGATSLRTSSAAVYVSNAWTQFAYNALRGSSEPNDEVIQNSIDVGTNTILAKSWVYATGAAINTEPAVVNGVAYVGNDAGVLSAVGAQSGSPAWTFKIPSGASIRSSPAVDGQGNVIFGANDGNLYVVSASGTLVKTLALGGNLGSAALDDASIIIASDNGTVWSIADSTWTTNWSVNAHAAVHSPPAFDAANGVVIVGNDGGTLTALTAATGVTLWTAATGGAITAAPAVYNGTVYVGSADSRLYAYAEMSGALQWSSQADAPIQTGVAIGSIYGVAMLDFGTKAGSVYQMTPSGGPSFYKAAMFGDSPIVGFAAAADTSLATTAAGVLGAVRKTWSPWSFRSAGSSSAPPAILNGTVYLGAGNGNLYAFSPNGKTPLSVVRTGGAIVTVTGDWSCTTEP